MTIVIGAHNDDSLQFDISGKRDIEKQFLIGIAGNMLVEIQPLAVGFEHRLAGSFLFLVQTFHVDRVDFFVQAVLDAHLQFVFDS